MSVSVRMSMSVSVRMSVSMSMRVSMSMSVTVSMSVSISVSVSLDSKGQCSLCLALSVSLQAGKELSVENLLDDIYSFI